MKVHYPKLYNMAHLSLNVFTASKGSRDIALQIWQHGAKEKRLSVDFERTKGCLWILEDTWLDTCTSLVNQVSSVSAVCRTIYATLTFCFL